MPLSVSSHRRSARLGASCWGCAFGITPLPTPAGVTDGGDALGHCYQCSVFVCARHGELDLGSGKWLCTKCVASLAAGSQPGVQSLRFQISRITSSTEFKKRFPITFRAAQSERERSRVPKARGGALSRAANQQHINRQLLADAAGTVRFLRGSSEVAVPLPDHLERLIGTRKSLPRARTSPSQRTQRPTRTGVLRAPRTRGR
jgi:hypothetical protein